MDRIVEGVGRMRSPEAQAGLNHCRGEHAEAPHM